MAGQQTEEGIVVKCLRCGWFVLRGRFTGTVEVACTNNGCGTTNVVEDDGKGNGVKIRALDRARRS